MEKVKLAHLVTPELCPYCGDFLRSLVLQQLYLHDLVKGLFSAILLAPCGLGLGGQGEVFRLDRLGLLDLFLGC